VRIARERVELQTGPLDHRSELPVSRNAHAVPLSQPATDWNEWLNVAARPDGHDDDRQRGNARGLAGGRMRGGEFADMGREPRRGMGKALGGMIEIDLQGARAGRDPLDRSYRSGTQASTVKPPAQERSGNGVCKALLPELTHLATGTVE